MILLGKAQEDGRAFPGFKKFLQALALAISGAWHDDRPPDGTVVSGHSRAAGIGRELSKT